MSDRLTRKDIKHDIQQDEFVATVGRGVDYAQHHGKQLLLGVVVVAVLGALVVAGNFWYAGRAHAAQDALAAAARVADAGIDAAAPKPDDPTAPSFATAAARRERAKAAMQLVVDKYPSADAADAARLYLAGFAIEEGQADKARELWRAYLAEHPTGMLAAATRISLWDLDRQQGKAEAVAAELRALLEDANRPLPEDAVLSELAKTLDVLGKPDESKAMRQRILDEFPRSSYRGAAQREIAGTGGLAMTVGN
jgi:tetratricopeptide (TPR) repeat protein